MRISRREGPEAKGATNAVTHRTMKDLDEIVGKRIWLEYFDQNYRFEEAFTPQYCTVVRRLADVSGQDDWYLVELGTPVLYENTNYSHLLIRSRWDGCRMGEKEATAVFIVLVPEPNALTSPFKLDRSLYIAWGMTAISSDDIKR